MSAAPDERDNALGDYHAALLDLRLCVHWLSNCDDDGKPIHDAEWLLKQVDKARQALQTIACCADFVGGQK